MRLCLMTVFIAFLLTFSRQTWKAMEGADRNGRDVAYQTGPSSGENRTNGQHAFYQHPPGNKNDTL